MTCVERIGAFLYATASEPVIVVQIDSHRVSAPVRLENLEADRSSSPTFTGRSNSTPLLQRSRRGLMAYDLSWNGTPFGRCLMVQSDHDAEGLDP